jgi:hypothetical protein
MLIRSSRVVDQTMLPAIRPTQTACRSARIVDVAQSAIQMVAMKPIQGQIINAVIGEDTDVP